MPKDQKEKNLTPSSDASVPGVEQGVVQTNLSSTTKAFGNRFQQKKLAQAVAHGEQEKETVTRHRKVLTAMTNIRRSLIDVTRIELGERFTFVLDADDWQGWPRLTIRLDDAMLVETPYPWLRVTAHDRLAKGAIDIMVGETQEMVSVSVNDEAQLQRLPVTLKKFVRTYLDMIGEIILEAERDLEFDADRATLEARNLKDTSAPEQPQAQQLSSDLYEESLSPDFLDTLPSLEALDELPDLLDASYTKMKE